MDDSQRLDDAEAFFCQILRLDGVSEDPPEPTSPLSQLMKLERECDDAGLSKAVFAVRAQKLLSRIIPRHDQD